METFSMLLAICAGNSPGTQRPVTPSFDVFFDLHLNKRLSKQSWGWWFETLLWPLWLHCNVPVTDGLPSQRANNAELWWFLIVNQNDIWNKQSRDLWIETPWHSSDITRYHHKDENNAHQVKPYCKTSSISRTKSQNLNVSCILL